MRVKLKPGEQRRFIEEVLRVMGWTQRELAEACSVSLSSVKHWYHERHTAKLRDFETMGTLAGVPLPKFEDIMSEEEWRSQRSKASYESRVNSGKSLGTPEGRSRGGATSQQRRKDHPEHYPTANLNQIRRPEISASLAEFVGIMLGDGGMTTAQVEVHLNPHEEQEYAAFVADLMDQLFGLRPSQHIYEKENGFGLVLSISSVQLVEFLTGLGLVVGNKVRQQCGVPKWVFEDVELMRACTRGMMDTDGCVYLHHYHIKDKTYSYIKMTYAGRSYPMLLGLRRMLQELGYKPGVVRKSGYLSISSDPAVCHYYEYDIGTHNPYHWRRYSAAVEATRKEN